MMAADPSLEIKSAIRTLARNWDGNLETHVERIRKWHRRLKQNGQLPAPEDESSRLTRRAGEIRFLYSQRDNQIEKSKKELLDSEKKAHSLGLDIRPSNLLAAIRDLERTRDGLETLARSSPEIAFAILLEQGVTDPERAVELVTHAASIFHTTEEHIELLRRIRNLRGIVGVPSLLET
jgi:hypothetical protein